MTKLLAPYFRSPKKAEKFALAQARRNCRRAYLAVERDGAWRVMSLAA